VDVRKGVQGERIRVAAALRSLRGDAPMTDAEIEAFVSRLSGVLGFAREQAGLAPRNVRARLRARVTDKARVDAARRLVESGLAQDLVKRLPPAQVILLDEQRDYDTRRDARIRLLGLPIWEIDALAGREERATDSDGLFDDLLPQIVKLRRAQARLEQQVALLRLVEALRLHGAGHGGRLPARLCDIAVPLPVDPFTGKSFVYAVEGTTAHLRSDAPRGPGPGSDVHYEVTLLK
jgi:hypothetical protein